ncbi:hypothetical protein Moror_1567 [Moniliophthora roreri MCA 2997]|uniref:F-box domain-containing protein n=1 Tax=Moniliophthora roreri (strain MCA 2997) TaxID=1381753 RepID=V2XL27_MONRO|nr:hypothetical protein Moror_1567 [Moniliophthora roreri MCA 2997]
MAPPEHLPPSVQNLPDLVLVEIFTKVGANTPDFDSWKWTLSHVCYKWRSVLLSFPSLWSTIHLPFPGTSRCSLAPASTSLILHRLKTQLSRSQTHPLTISLSLPICTHAHQHLEILLKPFCDESPRWQNLILAADFPSLHFLHSILDQERKGLPELRSLNLILPPHNSTAATTTTTTTTTTSSSALFENALRLRDLTITSDPYCYTAKFLGVPFAQITRFRVTDLSSEMCGLLSEMPHLETLIIHRLRSIDSEISFRLPSLNTLVISAGAGPDSMSRFLNVLDVPNLHTLRLGCNGSQNAEIARFLKSSKRSLRSIALALTANTIDISIDSLPPDLDSLYLYRPSSEVIRTILAKTKTRIRELALFSASEEVKGGAITDLAIASQSRGLKKLWLYGHDTGGEEALHRIRQCGVEVVQCNKWWSEFLLDV